MKVLTVLRQIVLVVSGAKRRVYMLYTLDINAALVDILGTTDVRVFL
jgi:hypothetical protein